MRRKQSLVGKAAPTESVNLLQPFQLSGQPQSPFLAIELGARLLVSLGLWHCQEGPSQNLQGLVIKGLVLPTSPTMIQ